MFSVPGQFQQSPRTNPPPEQGLPNVRDSVLEQLEAGAAAGHGSAGHCVRETTISSQYRGRY